MITLSSEDREALEWLARIFILHVNSCAASVDQWLEHADRARAILGVLLSASMSDYPDGHSETPEPCEECGSYSVKCHCEQAIQADPVIVELQEENSQLEDLQLRTAQERDDHSVRIGQLEAEVAHLKERMALRFETTKRAVKRIHELRERNEWLNSEVQHWIGAAKEYADALAEVVNELDVARQRIEKYGADADKPSVHLARSVVELSARAERLEAMVVAARDVAVWQINNENDRRYLERYREKLRDALAKLDGKEGDRQIASKPTHPIETIQEVAIANPMRPVVSRADLIAKLLLEKRTTEIGYSDLEVAARRGWNARTDELVQWLKENA